MNEAPRPPSNLDAVAPYVEAAVDAAFFVARVAAATLTAVALAYRPRVFQRDYAFATIGTILAAASVCPR